MENHQVIVNIGDDEIWKQRKAKLKALKSAFQPLRKGRAKRGVNYPALRAAAKKGDVDKFIQALEKYSAQERVPLSNIMDIRGPTGDSLLHIAAGIENPDIIQALLMVIRLKWLAKVNCRGDTALHFAVRAGRIRTAQLLLDRPRKMDKANDAGNKALHEAVKNRNCELTDLLLSRGLKCVYQKNKENKCPLYLALEMGNLTIFRRLMAAVDGNQVHGMSPVHGAVMLRELELLNEIRWNKRELFNVRAAGRCTPLHLAAYDNYVDGVAFLVRQFTSSAFKHDIEGYLPIHIACRMGHLEIVRLLLRVQHLQDPEEMLTLYNYQNILHVAAEHGRASVVKYILSDPKLEKLINEKDKEGNTPLHVAALHWQPEVLLSLTRDKRVDLKLVNHKNSTALDIVDERAFGPPLHQNLARTILLSAGAPKSKDTAIYLREDAKGLRFHRTLDLDRLKDTAGTRMVVATLIAAMTFAASFSTPGGYNGTKPHEGMATLLNKPMYGVFVMCNTVAMYSSTIAVVILLWTQINDVHGVRHALRGARLPLFIALAAMSMAFTAGVYVTVSKRTWLAVLTLIVGITALIIISGIYIALFVPLAYNSRFVQFFADYIIKAGMSISTRVSERRDLSPPREIFPCRGTEF
ncbi:protein ACCELERATED CELL DEATH 6-like [Rhodamnia argentea]|uniref:Protein ACCELERATED CELL DEATH 6-like n=1 Tax=Rhodamnia argentea TaxID=178133 RepID=A0A8B8MR46_9MYRT|nr:protein ACCELERATED CELL DEATH 6-like [Rhodamnia argentea]